METPGATKGSDVQPSVDPVSILLAPGEQSPVDNPEKSVAAGLVGLAYLAREAAEERRHKQCLEATKAILKVDPEHMEARKIQSAVRTELDEEFVKAQALAGEARDTDDHMLYERAAAMLRRLLDVDPDNLDARALLNETLTASYFGPAPPANVPSRRRVPRWAFVVSSAVIVLVAGIALVKGTGLQLSALLPMGTGVSAESKPSSSTASVDPGVTGPVYEVPTSSSVPDKPVWNETTTALPRVENSDRMLRAVASPPLPLAKPAAAPGANVATARMGALAVSAAVPVEIYRGEENLGSTPATLQLAEGPQTLEYRYQGLRQTHTHVIGPDQTTTVTVSFLIKLQINAQPWAQVFMDGTNLMPIGQTPLGDISVPIGTMLVFRNPGFPDKRHRVTARDTAIQITFSK